MLRTTDDITDTNVSASTITLCMREKHDKSSDFENYDPFQHRNIAHPTSTTGSFFNLLKSSLGSGLLAMPTAFKRSGVIPGCFGTVLVGLIATHCVHILVNTSRELCKEIKVPCLSYADTCEEAFRCGPSHLKRYSRAIRQFADFSMAAVCLGGTSVYVIFVATSLKDVSNVESIQSCEPDAYSPGLSYYRRQIVDHFQPGSSYKIEIYCLFLLIPLVLITQMRYLKFLVPFSIFANVCLLLTIGITCYYTFDDVPNLEDRELVANVKGWPMFISTAMFAMEGINVVMPIENEMAKPQHFLGWRGVLNSTMILVSLLYGVVGLFGYLKYGDAVKGSITLNLPQTEILALAAKVLVAAAVFFTYCLQMYAPMEIIWSRMKARVSEKYHGVCQVVLRTLSVVLTVTLAIAVPDLEYLINLVGAILFSTLGLLIPIVVETVHRWSSDLGPYKVVLWKNIFLFLFYLLVLISGCLLH